MTAARFAGARLDNEAVLLDRSTNRLIHLNEDAVRVWDACAPAEDIDAVAPAAGCVENENSPVLAALAASGLLRRVNTRYIRVPVEWQ
jgi:hypothetical protein